MRTFHVYERSGCNGNRGGVTYDCCRERTLPLRQIVFATGACLLVVGFSETVVFAVLDQGLHRAPSFFGVALPM